jgi:glycosyltransferase involved in cell wall biosynthesis
VKNKPLVSVIIYCRNSGKFIKSCLESLKNQSYKNIEIIIVDNNSKDNTKIISSSYTDKIYDYGPERVNQVNFGVAKSRGEYVIWKGPSTIVEETFIEQAVKKCEEESYDAIYFDVLTKVENPNIWQKVRATERACYYKEPGMSSAKFCRKSVFLELGGLDCEIGAIADDLAFQHRLNLGGYKTGFVNANIYYLGEHNNIKIILKRSLYYGWLMQRYYKKYPEKFKSQYKFVRKEFKKNILMRSKIVFIFFIFYKLVQYFFGGIGLVLAKITSNNQKIEKILYRMNFGIS